jgi:hypothetical protein
MEGESSPHAARNVSESARTAEGSRDPRLIAC